MRYYSVYNAVICLLAVTLYSATAVQAVEGIYPLVTFNCDTEADVLTITNSLHKGEQGTIGDATSDQHSYSLWDMVAVARKTDSTRIIKSSKATSRCKLSSGDYTVILEPQIFSKEIDSSCGEMITGAVTVLHKDSEILGRTAFEEYCHGNVPVITRITVFGKTAEYKIKRIPKSKFY